MQRLYCISCGEAIRKSSLEHAYLCRGCSTEQGRQNLYGYLDRGVRI